MQVASQQPQSSVAPGTFPPDSPPASRHQYPQPTSFVSGQSQGPPHSRGTPHSSQRPSRQPSGNGTEATQQGYQQSTGPYPSNSNVTQGQEPANTTRSSPIVLAPASSPSFQPSRRDHRAQPSQQGGPPISPPPRTSSNQRGQHFNLPSNAPVADRSVPARQNVQGLDDRPSSSRNPNDARQHDGREEGTIGDQLSGEDQEAANDAIAASAAANAARSRRRGPASPEGPQRATSTREPGAYASSSGVQSRSASNIASGPSGSRTPKDESQVINRVVVDDPAVDIKRAQERQLESVPGLSVVNNVAPEDVAKTTPRSRQDYSASSGSAGRRKETRFGEYILGQTLGEGEFGKVKLGWKKGGEVQVAIKLIRRETLNGNPARLPKIYREVTILRGLEHPNIVRLHEMIETPQYIGIILEYASGGELFDYILTHRYLKDNTARKLFAQLVSGVGYLHKKGIVHRDLKLENLLLDRNRNIVITDFGFANTFDPGDELESEIEQNLTDRNFVKRRDLDRVRENGSRRGDLMATSCGSPCYAAPELVVTDSLYTGRKVDVWSCGVILYAMLAGYLPFDDDPANPEGDNINLLYKYITTTPLTFPEYVTPHARDLLRRILVPDPRQRADLFEVARHSWLSDFAHVVAQVTSSTTTVGQIAATAVSIDQQEPPQLFRSASVREPAKTQPSNISPVGALSHQGKIDPEQASEKAKAPRDPKRRTVQVEYVAPQKQTVRGEVLPPVSSPTTEGTANAPSTGQIRTRARAGTEGPEIVSSQYGAGTSTSKPLPQDPSQNMRQGPVYQSNTGRTQQRPSSFQRDMGPPARPPKDFPRSVSDSTSAFGQMPPSATTRPTTGGSMTSTAQGRLPSRGNSYSQPLAPTVAATNAQGRLAQPKNGKQYNISAPIPQTETYSQNESIGVPSTQQYEVQSSAARDLPRGHKRSNTLGNFFRTGSISGGRSQPQSPGEPHRDKRHPPTSMKAPIAADSPRQSTDSRRPSFSFSRKNSDLGKDRDPLKQERPRRFSLLPASFSFKSLTSTGSGKDQAEMRPVSEQRQSSSLQQAPPSRGGQSRPKVMAYNRGQSGGSNIRQDENISGDYDGQRERFRDTPAQRGSRNEPVAGNLQQSQYSSPQYRSQPDPYPPPRPPQPGQSYLGTPTESEISLGPRRERTVYPQGFNSYEEDLPHASLQQGRSGRPGVLQKSNRKFADAYDQEGGGHHAGSSGAARRVMDFFRRRGKARTGEERG